ncbi:efflux RND transporter permease subunit [Gimesia maris]|uniref:Multidrug efflux system subunit MdtC n=1 Tax=Gimesia maris TaxID=122 RepID=A0ABX5YMR8_9PLAN|nr:efflux RND transporter permease subunit [Gimesia maris]EDL58981.1 possible RND Superfamily transporter [Gimesia maris DSM 8797]QEG16968.1 multidrug efflux system subunit MdtC [Gimesia maris]QGQ29903.1 MMPL family transporter [Gimesia maris]
MADHPVMVTLFILLLSGIALLGYTMPEEVRDWFKPAPVQQVQQQKPEKPRKVRETPPDVDPISLTDADTILVIDSEDFFTPERIKALREIVEQIESLDYVRSVFWLEDIPNLNIFGLREPLIPNERASQKRLDAAKEKTVAHPLVGGQLLSVDGKTLLLMIKFDWLHVTDDDACTIGLKDVAREVAAKYPGADFSFLTTGRVPIYLTAVRTHNANKVKYQVIGYGMILFMAVILFRGISAVIIVALAPMFGVFLTMGFIQFLDFQDNPFNDVVLPVLLSLVGLTDGVHLMVQIRKHRAAGLSGRDAARRGVQEVGLACLLTSVTTAIGFGSLSLAHHETVREFGYSCVVGVLLTFIAVITVIPLACRTWLGRSIHVGYGKGIIDRHLGRISVIIEMVLKRTRFISSLGIGVTAILILISLTLRPDERRANMLPDGSEAAVALNHMDRAMGGLEHSRVHVTWDDDVPSDSPEVLVAISEVDDLLLQEELIGHPISIRNILGALPGEGKPEERMSMMDLLPPPLKRAFYTPERNQAEVSFHVQDLGIARYGPTFTRIEEGLKTIGAAHPHFQFELTGSAVWRWRNLYQIVVDLAASLGSAAIIILVVLAFAFRSLRLGLISIIPNMFPLAVTGTFLVFTGQSLEIVSVCAFTVCLGIAVDDTIHFLTRFREEQLLVDSDEEAIRRAFTGVGTALIMTTVILVAGFSTVIFSDMRDQRIFAIMSGLTISSALFGDLVFLPALLARYAKRSQVPAMEEPEELSDPMVEQTLVRE